jgi:hypothetical protein
MVLGVGSPLATGRPASWRAFRADEQDEADRQGAHPREGGEDEIERDLVVPHDAEAPVGEAAATDAHQIHEAVGGGAVFRPDDLAEDGHVVAVKEPPADAVEDQECDGDAQRAGISHTEKGGDDESDTDGGNIDPPPVGASHPSPR